MGPELQKCERAPWLPTGPSRTANSIADVVDTVSRERGVSAEAILGRRHFPRDAAARHEVWRRLHALGWTCSEIARAFGRDHTTVMAALDRRQRRVA